MKFKLFASATATAFAANTYNIPGYDGKITMDYDAATQEAVMTADMPDNTWLGFTLGAYTMHDTDVLLFSASGATSKALDYYSTDDVMPTKDTQQDYKTNVLSSAGGRVKIEARRKLKTTDAKDFEFPVD